MSKPILIIGETGSGKTTSLASLPPDNTFIFDCDGKGLPWRKWREQYNVEAKNYARVADASKILEMLDVINTKYEHIKYVVIDTINAVMIADEMARIKEKGYDKWQDLAVSVYGLITAANKLRDDLVIIITAHTETVTEDGYKITRVKTSGQKLQKIKIESYFNTVLLTAVKDGEHYFITNNTDGSSTAKSPRGMFDSTLIPNDIMPVIEALEEF